jgi:hypothetical protein
VQSFGGARGRLLCVDFEEYSPKYSWLTPSNATLKAFNGRLNELSNNHPLILYSGSGFWDGGDSSGEFDQYDADVLWEARYPDLEVMPRPRDEYQSLKDWGWKGFGGEAPVFWQFTPAGTVAGMNIDVNAYRLPINHLRSLAVTPLPNENEEPNGVQPRSRGNELMRTVDEVAEYGMAHVRAGVRYWCWDQGNLDFPRPTVGRPASVDGKAPVPGQAKRGFCADLISWQLRKAGLPIPKNRFGNENYDGGTRSFRLRYARVMKPFKLSECRRGDVVFVDFQTPWAPEGHIAFCLGDGPEAKLLQSHLDTFCAVGEPGFNATFTLAQSNSMPTGKNYYTHRIPREEIWG